MRSSIGERRFDCVKWLLGIGVGLGICPHRGVGEELRLETLQIVEAGKVTEDAKANPRWYDAKLFDFEGKGWADTAEFYHRLPGRAKGVVRDPVWGLSTNTAGLCVRFVTDADKIAARWTVTRKSLAMDHMPATGVSGVDLYVRYEGSWRWIGNGRPKSSPTNTATLADGIPRGVHEYLLYLPLYNGVQSLEIGLPLEAKLAKAPPRPGDRAKPIVYYGTSIAQGGCASRPGMAHPAILGRRLDWHVINLGFSGNGQMEMALCKLMAEIDAAMYVLDCVPNLNAEKVTERTEPFVLALRKARPEAPIVLVENIEYQAGAFLPARREAYESKNKALREAYERLLAKGVKGLYYIPGKPLLGTDGEATVDGTHCSDLGFQRYADGMEPVLRKILETGK
ncbi:MAG: SGNH/GDSL hydrolase family protein [Phycisphaerae bacterium]|nr:SGNH/GDSL hydrolase family protein [Phycisphaerae bacterium]